MYSGLRIVLLLGLLTAIFLGIGFFFAGMIGMTIGLVLSFAMSFVSYWFSDKFVIKLYGAKKSDSKDYKELDKILQRLSEKTGIKKPSFYIMKTDIPNAFATGRSPKHSAVAVTTGLMDKLSNDEIEGVLAHEISHIAHRDTLLNSMAATIGGAITWLGYMFYFGNEENRSALSFVLLFILAPLAAMLVRMAISRNREYFADHAGALLSKPTYLANALEKIHDAVKHNPAKGNPAAAHVFIVNPFSAGSVAGLFSTHPPMAERVKRLREMR
ncbi:MAG TPA: zinc metalloprotease HtpX [archaeon]|nr:zinc metalloprotease HtpX [archaeon]